jgi:hypothetical protein
MEKDKLKLEFSSEAINYLRKCEIPLGIAEEAFNTLYQQSKIRRVAGLDYVADLGRLGDQRFTLCMVVDPNQNTPQVLRCYAHKV